MQREEYVKRVVTLSLLLAFGALSQPALASAAGFPQGMRSTPLLTLVKCWHVPPRLGGGVNEICETPFRACLQEVYRKFGLPKDTRGGPQTDGSQPFYDKCDAARSACEEPYCK
jgi:hypothetical protein